uniref:Uncharacterized protein n=1 Tax=Ananas comosus var. bracteatus TaxID=296719 RepID=A0A6V7PFH2_ANACO|nr:unnamed protein product [Ananas comosus var. bracteatus]
MQSEPTLAKLDRFRIFTEWDHVFSLSKVLVLRRVTSDHTLFLFSTCERKLNQLFRFEEVWLSREDFNEKMPVWWNEVSRKRSNILNFAAKLRHCRKRSKNDALQIL